MNNNEDEYKTWSQLDTDEKVLFIIAIIILIALVIGVIFMIVKGFSLLFTGHILKGLSLFGILYCLYKLSKHPKSPLKIEISKDED